MESRAERGQTLEERGEEEGRIGRAFYSLWLSLVRAGIFILPGENANHQSQAACYVSV